MAIKDVNVYKTIESVTEISPDLKIQVLWNTVPCQLIVTDISKCLYLIINTASYPRRLESASPPL